MLVACWWDVERTLGLWQVVVVDRMVEGWRSILPARQRAALEAASAIERVALGACKLSL